MMEADIGMTEHRSKNTLGRSVPVKTMTDVEDDGISEDGSPESCLYLKGVIQLVIKTQNVYCRRQQCVKG